jgi:hypothetical protein
MPAFAVEKSANLPPFSAPAFRREHSKPIEPTRIASLCCAPFPMNKRIRWNGFIKKSASQPSPFD